MNPTDYYRARAEASQFMQKNGIDDFDFDTLVAMHYTEIVVSRLLGTAKTAPVSPDTNTESPQSTLDIPDWFMDGLPQFAARKVNAKTILEALGRPCDLLHTRQAGTWLRALYGPPTRSNGNNVYLIGLSGRISAQPPAEAVSKLAPASTSKPANNLPITARVSQFAAEHMGQMVTVEQVCMAIGEPPISATLREIEYAMRRDCLQVQGTTYRVGKS